MKTRHYLFRVLLAFALGAATGPASAQVINQNGSVYRITAVRNNHPTVTSTSNYAKVEPLMNVYIPNAFTPNGDGINDTFGIKGEGSFEYNLAVFNRWGEKIFESQNPGQQWDGTYKNQPVQPGEYVYQLMAHGKKYKGQTGVVTLVR
jgi:gliding motility-associated-like protein